MKFEQVEMFPVLGLTNRINGINPGDTVAVPKEFFDALTLNAPRLDARLREGSDPANRPLDVRP